MDFISNPNGIVDEKGNLIVASDWSGTTVLKEVIFGQEMKTGDLCHFGKNGKMYKCYSAREGVYHYIKLNIFEKIWLWICENIIRR